MRIWTAAGTAGSQTNGSDGMMLCNKKGSIDYCNKCLHGQPHEYQPGCVRDVCEDLGRKPIRDTKCIGV